MPEGTIYNLVMYPETPGLFLMLIREQTEYEDAVHDVTDEVPVEYVSEHIEVAYGYQDELHVIAN